jgi:hypothetical protein
LESGCGSVLLKSCLTHLPHMSDKARTYQALTLIRLTPDASNESSGALQKYLLCLLLYVGRLRPLWAFYDLKFDRVPFLQGPISIAYYCRVMNENVRTIIPPYKAISLRIVKPFHFTNHLALLLRIVRGLAEENTIGEMPLKP